MALDEALRDASGGCEVVGLLTTVAREDGRVPIQGVRRALVEAQARALGLPLHVVEIPKGASNAEYERALKDALAAHAAAGVRRIVFGDLFLADVRAYREQLLRETGVRPSFPLWGRDTRALAAAFAARGFRAVVTSVNARWLDGSFAGRLFDHHFLAALPDGVDPCGERGEFHTFVFDGPLFKRPVAYTAGVALEDAGHYLRDLLPA